MNNFRLILVASICICAVQFAFGQKNKGGVNLPKFDYKPYHFGFLLSTNSADFTMSRKADFTFNDSLLSIDNMRQPGFNLALLASLNITKNVNIRFVPGLSFQDRALNYRFLETSGKISETPKRIESVYLDFPLLLKLRTNRTGNFAAYALVGGKYSRDMQSQKDVNQNIEEELIVKIKDVDYSIDVGGGFDFFLNYFKFGIELKTAFGLRNVLLPETHQYSAPLNSLRTRTFVLSFTFEG